MIRDDENEKRMRWEDYEMKMGQTEEVEKENKWIENETFSFETHQSVAIVSMNGFATVRWLKRNREKRVTHMNAIRVKMAKWKQRLQEPEREKILIKKELKLCLFLIKNSYFIFMR